MINYVLHIIWAEHVFGIQIISPDRNMATKEYQTHFEPYFNMANCFNFDEEDINTQDSD